MLLLDLDFSTRQQNRELFWSDASSSPGSRWKRRAGVYDVQLKWKSHQAEFFFRFGGDSNWWLNINIVRSCNYYHLMYWSSEPDGGLHIHARENHLTDVFHHHHVHDDHRLGSRFCIAVKTKWRSRSYVYIYFVFSFSYPTAILISFISLLVISHSSIFSIFISRQANKREEGAHTSSSTSSCVIYLKQARGIEKLNRGKKNYENVFISLTLVWITWKSLTHLMSYRLYFIIFIRMKFKPQLSGNLCLLLVVTVNEMRWGEKWARNLCVEKKYLS